MRRLLILMLIGGPFLMYAQEGEQPPADQQAAPAEGSEAPAAAGGGDIAAEDTIVGEADYKIDDAVKPIVDVQLRPFEPLDSFIVRRERGLERRLPPGVEKELAEVIKLHNRFLKRPVYPRMIHDKIVIELGKYPKPDKWKIVIYNSAGIPVKTFEGRGGLPKRIEWDGFSDKGKPVIKPGEKFTYRVYLERKSGARRREVGELPEIVGFFTKTDKGDHMVFLSLDYIFQPGRVALRPDGEERVIEMLNYVKDYYRGKGPVDVYVYSKGTFLWEDRAKILKELILKNAPIDPEKLHVKRGYFGQGAKYERVELRFRE
ncbi:MAG: hypothetical protein GXO29_06910 [Thermotogae bacterium]|nr:hypothetical protein [Thermotogota bacterium]